MADPITPETNPYLTEPPPEAELTRKAPPVKLPPVKLEQQAPNS